AVGARLGDRGGRPRAGPRPGAPRPPHPPAGAPLPRRRDAGRRHGGDRRRPGASCCPAHRRRDRARRGRCSPGGPGQAGADRPAGLPAGCGPPRLGRRGGRKGGAGPARRGCRRHRRHRGPGAAGALVGVRGQGPRLPPWRIVAAEDPARLLADYRAAQAASGVGWSYLAAINFVETDFGRVAGPSSAGAQGPMQFLPATWAIYGHGNIHRPRDAILAAGRFLAGNGAAHSIRSALYAYNPSWRYVDAVLRYALRLRADPHALMGYYRRQVVYRLASGWVLLPAGYGIDPAVRAIPVRV